MKIYEKCALNSCQNSKINPKINFEIISIELISPNNRLKSILQIIRQTLSAKNSIHLHWMSRKFVEKSSNRKRLQVDRCCFSVVYSRSILYVELDESEWDQTLTDELDKITSEELENISPEELDAQINQMLADE